MDSGLRTKDGLSSAKALERPSRAAIATKWRDASVINGKTPGEKYLVAFKPGLLDAGVRHA
jgi:hypothetical protein